MDLIEHLHPNKAQDVLSEIISLLKPGGSIVTNFFHNTDYANVEHIYMEHYEVEKLFTDIHELTMVPIVRPDMVVKNMRWVKA